jgi:hypothetical protein
MKLMKNKWIFAIGVFMFAGCVDEFEEAQDPKRLDAPAAFAVLSGKVVNAENLNEEAYNWVALGETIHFDINVADAPGLIEEVRITQEDEFGIASQIGNTSFDLAPVKGQEKGSFSISYEPVELGVEVVEIEVLDAQSPQKNFVLNNFDPIRVVNGCLSNTNLVGFYTSVASGFDSETGQNYSNITSTIEIYIRANGIDFPGYYRMRNGSFGLYTEQGYGDPIVNIAVCGDTLTTGAAPDGIQYAGTVNDDGTIDITWSNVYGDTGTVRLTPQ